jgi:hypothetical protein
MPFLLTFLALVLCFPALVVAQTGDEPRSHIAVLGGLAFAPGRAVLLTEAVPEGPAGAVEISGGTFVSPRIGIDVEFATMGEREASTSFGRAVASTKLDHRHRDIVLGPLLRIRTLRRETAAVDVVAGVGWLGERFESRRRNSGGIPPAPLSETVSVTRTRRNAVVFTAGAEATGWMTRFLGLTASGRFRVFDRDDDQPSRPSAAAVSASVGVRVRF